VAQLRYIHRAASIAGDELVEFIEGSLHDAAGSLGAFKLVGRACEDECALCPHRVEQPGVDDRKLRVHVARACDMALRLLVLCSDDEEDRNRDGEHGHRAGDHSKTLASQ
jgi:hypothetical protein